jgi:3-deoxy-D-manno-octulosonic-acid transferase
MNPPHLPGSPARGPGWPLRLYGLVMTLLLPALLLRLWWRGRAEPLYREALGERLGLGPRPDRTGRLWIHAVSLGETRASAALVEALRARRPGLQLLLTHGTATGRAAGAALMQPGDVQAWLPWDSPGAVRRFLARHRPVLGVLMETEVWPALLDAASRQGVPMLLANARLSARSLRRGERLAGLMRPALQGLQQVLAQTDGDAERLRALGATEVQVHGNLKFDMAPDPRLLARGRAWRAALGRPVVLASSTREGEEAALLSHWASAAAAHALRGGEAPLLLVVPRHPQRFDEVAELCRAAGLSLARRSAWAGQDLPPAGARQAEVWLGDSLGELPLYYALADVALLGGSFAPLGGQNLIEAAACGCPLWMGPSTFNFDEAASGAEAAGAASRASDLPAAIDGALLLLADPPRREAQARRALDFAAAHRGAADRMAAAILEAWPGPG